MNVLCSCDCWKQWDPVLRLYGVMVVNRWGSESAMELLRCSQPRQIRLDIELLMVCARVGDDGFFEVNAAKSCGCFAPSV
jgi:hypothetical protein